jgi:large subunit ribosomal protein L28
MSRICQLTGKKPGFGNAVSFSNRKNRRVWNINLQTKRVYVPELDRFIKLRLSTRAIRTLNKKGLMQFLRDQGLTLKDIT